MDELTITISDLLAIIIRKGKQIILIGVALALLLGAAKGVASDEGRLDQELLEYEQKLLKLESAIEKASEDADKVQNYIDNSLWMKIDPHNKYEASFYLSISGVDEHALSMSFGPEETPADYLTKRIATQYRVLWDSLDLSSELGISRYENVLDKYVREVVDMSILDDGILQITAIGNSKNEVRESADAARNLLTSLAEVVAKNSYPHSLDEFNYVEKNQIDGKMADAQGAYHELLDGYNGTITEAENKLRTLAAPESIRVAVIKMVVIGGVVGVALACIWFVGKSLLQDFLLSSAQVEQSLGLPLVGSATTPKGLFARIATAISGERVWKDEAQALGYISETVKMRATGDQILLLSTLPLDASSENVQKVYSALAEVGLKPTCAGDFSHNPDALLQLSKCDSVVLLESVDKTKLSNVSKTLQFAKELEKPVVGFVMI